MLGERRENESKNFLKAVQPLAETGPHETDHECYRFGPWTLNPASMQLMRDGVEVALTPKAYDTLLLLLRHRDRVLTISELVNAVWPGVFVEKANVHQTISVLRKTLGVRDRKSLIVTIPRRGYRFAGDVELIAHDSRAAARTPDPKFRPIAYSSEATEYYAKGLHCFERWSGASSKADTENAIALFREAVRIEPKWALPRAQLAYAHTVMAMFFEPGKQWAESATTLLGDACGLDKRMAEVHVVRSEMLWSPVEGFQIEAAVLELKQGQSVNPYVGQAQLGILCAHQGFEEPALERLERAIQIEPASIVNQSRLAEAFIWLGKPREAVNRYNRLIDLDPHNPGHHVFSAIACISAGDLPEARRRNDQALALKPSDAIALSTRALLEALEGDIESAEQQVRKLANCWRAMRSGHHVTQNIACIRALQGKCESAVEWLRNTIRMGMCNYRMIDGDINLERIRRSSAYRDFMTETRLGSLSLLQVFR
jgi:DNA-binding winged helix-turn-helix (wHTH) protein/Flp pilus assembly protein TadD